MTKNQVRLIRAEIHRHLAMAHVAADARMQADHLAVAAALRGVLAAEGRRKRRGCSQGR